MAKDGHGPMRFYGATGGRDGEEVRLRNVSTSTDFHKHVFHAPMAPGYLSAAAKPADAQPHAPGGNAPSNAPSNAPAAR